jgi:hypothetical protein
VSGCARSAENILKNMDHSYFLIFLYKAADDLEKLLGRRINKVKK